MTDSASSEKNVAQPANTKVLRIPTFPLCGWHLIEASAGTGKTYTIAGLYLRLLLGHGTAASGFGSPLPVDQILVVTFTEAATAELRERILHAIRTLRRALEAGESSDALFQQLMDECPNRALALRQLLLAEQQIDAAAIYTIHGFCQRMLTQNAFESGSLFDNEFLTEEQQLRRDAVADFWRSLTWQIDPVLARALLRHWIAPDALLRDLIPHLTLAELVCEPRNADTLPQRHAQIVRDLQILKQQWLTDAANLNVWIAASDVAKQTYSKRNLPLWLDKVTEWAQQPVTSYEYPKELERFSRTVLQGKSKSGQVPDVTVCALIESWLAAPQDIDDVVMAQALVQVRLRLRQQKQRQQQLSFDDLLSQMAAALQGSRGEMLAERIREQYPVAMIDEFQDTDPQQYRIFSAIYAGHDECGFYMIGDPKQAIYAFRGADIFTYMAAKTQASATYSLETNYRSTQALVSGVNALFSVSGKPFVYQDSIPFDHVRARGKPATLTLNQVPQPALQCCFLQEESAPACSGADYNQMAAQAAAAQIHHWLTEGQRGHAHLGDRPVQPADIAVLVRSRREASLIEQALLQCGIASVYLSNRDSVFTQPVVMAVERLLEACLNPDDERAIRALMATDLMGWTASQLAELNDSESTWELVVDAIQESALIWHKQGVLPMIRQWLFRYNIPAQLLAQPQGERTLTDILHVGELLQTAASTLNGEHALYRWLVERCLQPSGDTDEQQMRLDSERQRVQIVTIHKSKGLQYNLVLLPFICSYRGNTTPRYHDHRRQRVTLDLRGDDTSYALAAEERLAEDLRLLYVALTRGVYLTWLGIADIKVTGRTTHRDDRPSALAYLFQALGDVALGTVMRRWIAAHGQQEEVASVGALPLPPVEARYVAEEPAPVQLQARRFTRTIERNWRVTSYSALTAQVSQRTVPVVPVLDVSPEGNQEVLLSAAEAVSAPVYDVFHFPKGAQPGTFLHSLLEDLDFRSHPAQLRVWVQDHLQGVQLSRDWQADCWLPVLVDWLQAILYCPLAESINLAQLSPARCFSELEFLLPLAPVSAGQLNRCLQAGDSLSAQAPALFFYELQGMLKGFIDLVFEHQGRFYIADYKSNYLGDSADAYQLESMQAAMIAHRYDVQYQLYTLALHRYLQQRIPDYDYDRHIGGVFYLFLRGMGPEPGSGVYRCRPSKQHILALDALFRGVSLPSEPASHAIDEEPAR